MWKVLESFHANRCSPLWRTNMLLEIRTNEEIDLSSKYSND